MTDSVTAPETTDDTRAIEWLESQLRITELLVGGAQQEVEFAQEDLARAEGKLAERQSQLRALTLIWDRWCEQI